MISRGMQEFLKIFRNFLERAFHREKVGGGVVMVLFHNSIPLLHGPDPMEWLLNVGNHAVKPFSVLYHDSTSFFPTSFIKCIQF